MKTYMAKTGEVAAKWHVIDASGKVLGRLAAQVAPILMGKHRPEYTPHVDTGDFVIIVNAAKVRVTGLRKPMQREYQRYTGYPGGLKSVPLAEMLRTKPEKVVSDAIRRMLPKNKLGVHMLKKLKVYAGPEHPHQAKQPQALEIEA